jgi:hypothetical protein
MLVYKGLVGSRRPSHGVFHGTSSRPHPVASGKFGSISGRGLLLNNNNNKYYCSLLSSSDT